MLETQSSASMLLYVEEFSEHYKEDRTLKMRDGLSWPHRRLSGSSLWFLQPLHLQTHVCPGCRLHRPAEVLCCAWAVRLQGFILLLTSSSVAAASNSMSLHARAPECAGCGSLQHQQYPNTSPILSEHPLL